MRPLPPGQALGGIVDRLEALGYRPKREGNRVRAFCPVHDDRRTPNLLISSRPGAGKADLRCFACPDGQTGPWLRRCMEALDLEPRLIYDAEWGRERASGGPSRGRPVRRRLPPAPRPGADLPPPTGLRDVPDHPWLRSAEAVYVYREVRGGPIAGLVIRWPTQADGRRPRATVRPTTEGLVAGLGAGDYGWSKRHRLWRRDERGPGVPLRTFGATALPFYGWDEVGPEVGEGRQQVIWAAGERDRDALARHGFLALAHPHGEGQCRPDLAALLAGHAVVIVFDADEAGERGARRVFEGLRHVAHTVRIVPGSRLREAAEPLGIGGRPGLDLSDLVEAWEREDPESVGERVGRLIGVSSEDRRRRQQ